MPRAVPGTLLLFSRAMGFDFTNDHDPRYLTNNPHVPAASLPAHAPLPRKVKMDHPGFRLPARIVDWPELDA